MSQSSGKATVAIVSTDQDFHEGLADALRPDFAIVSVRGDGNGFTLAEGSAPDLLLFDLNSGTNNVREFLDLQERFRRNDQDTVIIVLSDDRRPQTALRAMGAGAYDYFLKPINPAVLRVIMERAVEKLRIERENRLLRQEVTRRKSVGNLLGSTDAMQDLFDSINRVARSTATVRPESRWQPAPIKGRSGPIDVMRVHPPRLSKVEALSGRLSPLPKSRPKPRDQRRTGQRDQPCATRTPAGRCGTRDINDPLKTILAIKCLHRAYSPQWQQRFFAITFCLPETNGNPEGSKRHDGYGE